MGKDKLVIEKRGELEINVKGKEKKETKRKIGGINKRRERKSMISGKGKERRVKEKKKRKKTGGKCERIRK